MPEPTIYHPHAGPQRVFAFILRYKTKHDGNSPSYREIAEACGYASLSGVAAAVYELARAGLVTLGVGGTRANARAIHVVGGAWSYQGQNGRGVTA